VHVEGSLDCRWRWRMTLDGHEPHVTLRSTFPRLPCPLLLIFPLPHTYLSPIIRSTL
jgi:hypothetical protein